MKVIYNSWFPFGSFHAINLFGVLFVKGESVSEKTLNHEAIHTAQMKELLYIGFYLWYFLEWAYQGAVRFFNDAMKPYYFITMEQEAYKNESSLEYLSTRPKFAFMEFWGKWVQY